MVVNINKHKRGGVAISKSTNGEFFIEIEGENGDQLCQAVLTAEQFAHAITGKHVKAGIRVYKNAVDHIQKD